MTSLLRIKSSFGYILHIFGLMVFIAGCAQANGQNIQDAQMTQSKMTLWQAIDVLSNQIPFSKTKVEKLLSTQFTETDEGGNDVFQFFKSDPIKLLDGVVIENVDLRIKRIGPNPGFLALDMGGSCVTLDDVRAHYKDLRITDRPRGRSLDEVTSHTTTLPGGDLSFSFKESNRTCLASVVLNPQKAKTGGGSGE